MLSKFKGAKFNLPLLVTMAMLIAMGIVVGQFLSIGSQTMRVSFAFIINTIMGAVAGPIWTGISLGISDVVGTLLFGKFGYFPGFTFSAVIVGLLYGFFFFRKKLAVNEWQDWLYVFLVVTFIMLVDSLFFNTLWVSVLYKAHFTAYLMTRLPLLLQIPVRTVIIMLVLPALQRIKSIDKILN